MIIWGSYVIHKKLNTGEFYCPSCTNSRTFVHKRPRRWGHLYWIPLIPMDTYDSFVECQACKKTFHEQVLDHDPRRDRRDLETNISVMIGQIMTHVAHAQKTDLAMPTIAATVRDILGLDTLPPEAEARIASPGDRNAMLDTVREYGVRLVPGAQETVLVKAVGAVPLTPEIRGLVGEIGAAMGMTAAHVNGVLADIERKPPASAPSLAANERRSSANG